LEVEVTTESTLTQQFQAELKRRRFKVFKHCDKFTKGVPDTSASRNHKTTWYEFKKLDVKKWITELDWNRVIDKDSMVQLANMVDLERDAIAFYVLFVVNGKNHEMFIASPNQVLYSVKNKKAIFLGVPTTLDEMERWS
jgi:hypothetical protein